MHIDQYIPNQQLLCIFVLAFDREAMKKEENINIGYRIPVINNSTLCFNHAWRPEEYLAEF